jgi:hypothetical protein
MRISTILFGGIFFALSFISCEEEPPTGLKFKERPLLDTSYLSSAPAPQTKQILLIDITGVRCNNCPRAAEKAHELEKANPGKIQLLAIYPNYKPLSNPWEGFDTLVNKDADDLVGTLGAVTNLPSGIIDNVSYNGKYFIDENSWSIVVDQQKVKTTPINIDLKATWLTDEDKGRVEIKAIANTNIPSTTKLNWVIAILEDDMVGWQSTPTGVEENYTFKHVMRKLVTSAYGDPLPQLDMPAGFTVEKHYYIPRVSKWKADKLSCMVWVLNADTKEILQVNKVKFIP